MYLASEEAQVMNMGIEVPFLSPAEGGGGPVLGLPGIPGAAAQAGG